MRLFPRALRSAGVCLAVLLGGCVTDYRYTAEYDRDYAGWLLTSAYHDIYTVHIVKPSTPELVLTGLNGLSRIEPGLSADMNDEEITLSLDGAPIWSALRPKDADFNGWALLTANAIWASRARSTALGLATSAQLYKTVLDGPLKKFDGLSSYRGPEELREALEGEPGEPGSLGLRLATTPDGPLVSYVEADSPAERAGILAGDLIARIDDIEAAALEPEALAGALNGPVGSPVVLTIDRAGLGKALRFRAVREEVFSDPINLTRNGDIAYLRLSGFPPNAADFIEDQIHEAGADGFFKGLVLDLRGNGGGRLIDGFRVADLFLTGGTIVTTEGRHGDSAQSFSANAVDAALGVPMVVLINGFSGGAAELVAAALQDAERAVVVGSTSSGNAFVQRVFPLANGGLLTLPWALNYAASGYTWQARGVMPGLCTSVGDTDTATILALLRNQALPIPGEVRRSFVDPWDAEAVGAFRGLCPPSAVEPAKDKELARSLLSDPRLYSLALGRAPV